MPPAVVDRWVQRVRNQRACRGDRLCRTGNSERYIASKKEAFTLYRQYVNDEWTDLLETIWEKYRNELAYKIPESKAEREQLRKLRKEVLAFENHFFALFIDFAVRELKAITSGRRKATVGLIPSCVNRSNILWSAPPVKLPVPLHVGIIGQLGRIVFPEAVDEVIGGLRSIVDNGDDELQREAKWAIGQIQKIT